MLTPSLSYTSIQFFKDPEGGHQTCLACRPFDGGADAFQVDGSPFVTVYAFQ